MSRHQQKPSDEFGVFTNPAAVFGQKSPHAFIGIPPESDAGRESRIKFQKSAIGIIDLEEIACGLPFPCLIPACRGFGGKTMTLGTGGAKRIAIGKRELGVGKGVNEFAAPCQMIFVPDVVAIAQGDPG